MAACALTTPDDPNARIWRYMDFAKFVFLIDTRALFFAYADHFVDAMEGREPGAPRGRRGAVISSWHRNEHESQAMWQLYSPLYEAIAVQSTYARLRACLPNATRIHEVCYSDAPDASGDDPLHHLFIKRRAFEHERELRAVAVEAHFDAHPDPGSGPERTPAGWLFPVDLDALLEGVYVSPTAPDWLYGLVTRLCRRYGAGCPVRHSELAGTLRGR